MSKGRPTTATIGGARLQLLRRQAGKTQLVVEADAGLGSGYVQRIESGKVRQPERATLERLLDAIDARYSERRDVLALFGYRVATPLPDQAEIAWARAASAEELRAVPFPAYTLDCGARLLAWNALAPRLFPVVGSERQQILDEHWSMLRIWLDPSYGVTGRVRNPDVLFPQMVRAFRHELQAVADEPWCEPLVAGLVRDLPLFRAAWERTGPPATASAARALVPLQLAAPQAGLLQFRISAEPFTRDARFRVVYLLPADPPTMDRCARWGGDAP